MLLWRATKRKSEECRSKEQRSQFSELSFEFALALWLQWFCKIHFQIQLLSNCKFCELSVLLWTATKRKSEECCSKEQRSHIFRVIFQICFGFMTAMILKNTISRFNFFWIESFDSSVCYFGEPLKKICWMSQQGTEKSIFRVIFRIGFGIMTAMILQNTISRFNFFEVKVLWAECVILESYEKKNLLNVTERNREVHIQSSLSNWILLYDYNDSAKYHFQIQLISN